MVSIKGWGTLITPKDKGGVAGYEIRTQHNPTFIREDMLEELAVLILGGLTNEEFDAAVGRALEKHGHNFGATGLLEHLGLSMDRLDEYTERLRNEREATE